MYKTKLKPTFGFYDHVRLIKFLEADNKLARNKGELNLPDKKIACDRDGDGDKNYVVNSVTLATIIFLSSHCTLPGGPNASELPPTVSRAHSPGGRGQRPLDAGGADGQLPGVSEADDAAAARDRVAARAAAYVWQSVQDRQG